MKKERIIIARDFLITQMNHWIFYTIVMTVSGICGVPKPSLGFWALYSLIPFVLFLARRYFDAFWQILLSHGVILGMAVLFPAPDKVQKILSLMLVTAYEVYSLYLRLHVNERADTFVGKSGVSTDRASGLFALRDGERMDGKCNPFLALLFSAAAMSLRHYQGQISRADELSDKFSTASQMAAEVNLDRYYIIAVVLFFALYCLEYYMERYLHFLQVNESSTGHMPAGEIFRSGLRLTFGYTGLGVILMLLVSHVEWLAGAGDYVRRFLQWLFHFLPEAAVQSGEEETIEYSRENINLPEQLGLEDGSSAAIWDILEKLVLVAGAIALIGLTVWVCFRLFCYFREKFSIRAHVDKSAREAVVDVRESCAIEKKEKEKSQLWDFLTYAGRVRRIYKKEVLKSLLSKTAGGLLATAEEASESMGTNKITRERIHTMTPAEWGQAAKKETLAAVYEKIRYSNEECTAEDVRIAKS